MCIAHAWSVLHCLFEVATCHGFERLMQLLALLQALALECMAYDAQARPTFQQIEARLTQLQGTVQSSSHTALSRAPGAAAAAAEETA